MATDTSASTASPTLNLTAKEKQLRDLLVDVAASIDAAGRSPQPLVLRWAGGWVRDKLLGIESHDIDTAINAMTGYAFSMEMRDYCTNQDNIKRHNISPGDLGGLHKIAANPDKSKHLETATCRIFGLDVDFVNLRKETYADDSRNPTMEFGTAREDARRRDATINALFYNLHDSVVEDMTSGLADMKSRLIRTPMCPLQTFTDDPLRVLRLVRFASRLDFTIDPAATAVMSEPSVLEALKLKISRERVGVEVEKMLRGKHPRSSLELIHNLGLYGAIFTDPNTNDRPPPDVSKWRLAYECLDRLACERAPGSIYDTLVVDDDAAYFAWALAAVAPYAHVDTEVTVPKSKGTLPLATLVAREGIKAPNKLCDVITGACRHRSEIASLKQSTWAKEPRASERDTVGMAIRKWDSRGGRWRVQVLYALLVEAMEKFELGSDADNTQFLLGWQKFVDHLADLDLLDAPNLRRLVDGRLLTQELGIRPGKWLGQALDVCVAWQLRHRGETDPAGAIAEPHRQVIKALSLCLNLKERIERVPEDDVAAARITSHAAGLLCRSPSGLPLPLPHSADAAPAEDVLAVLRALNINYSAHINDDTLLSVVAYTDSNTTWSTETIALMAEDLLDCALTDEHRKRVFITSVVLEGFIRPLFSQSSSSRITSTGRKAHYADDDRDHASKDIFASDAETVPWKGDQLHAITVFSWAVERSDEQVVGKNWPLFTPVLLALIDDTDTRYKAQGLAILQSFLARCPSSVLQDTGLGEIFEQSIFPSLMSLPTLTPEEESVQLLDPAYGAAIRLASAQFPEERSRPRKNRLFVRLLREGIISGYWYASEYPRTVELLVRQASLVVQHLGTFTIPHVKDLLSMFAAIMTDPFFVSCPTCIEATSQALSSMMLNCWPRISRPAHSGELLRALSRELWLQYPASHP
ncbi:putative poly polymerase protein [Colletotrichum karsti]|uniref:Poly polymerase protein n=1 Tax=Colletotrichum karsti TaxID=1095194 RepID=A0A9P6HVS3_9PEZI|nr:putative poly polymerase protein [Colletotrichum karsti]KAF9870862.1 putative poly polymerase protein [Colletotrichum karsti]